MAARTKRAARRTPEEIAAQEKADEHARINRQFGAALKAAREGRGLSYRRTAELLEISLSHLQAIEAGEKGPSLAIAWTAARSLGFNLDRVCRDTL